MNLLISSCSKMIWDDFGVRWSAAAVEACRNVAVYIDSGDPVREGVEFRRYSPGVDAISANPRFDETALDKSLDITTRYYRTNTRFWLRKVFAVLDASRKLADGDLLCWMDMDCMAANPTRIWETAGLHDVSLHFLRPECRDWATQMSDTGLITFRMSAGTRRLILKWAKCYSSGSFLKTDYWADNCTFDLLRKGKFSYLDWHNLHSHNGNISDEGVRIGKHLLLHLKMKKLRTKEWHRQQKEKLK